MFSRRLATRRAPAYSRRVSPMIVVISANRGDHWVKFTPRRKVTGCLLFILYLLSSLFSQKQVLAF